MRGSDKRPGRCSPMWTEGRARRDHPLRRLPHFTAAALGSLGEFFSRLYSGMGRPSVPPEMLPRAFYSIRSERQLMEQLEFDLLFRRIVGLGTDDLSWGHSSVSKNATPPCRWSSRADRPRAISLGADKGHNAEDFVKELKSTNVRSNVAQIANRRRSAIDGRTTRYPAMA